MPEHDHLPPIVELAGDSAGSRNAWSLIAQTVFRTHADFTARVGHTNSPYWCSRPNAAVPNAGRCEQGPLPSGDPRPNITDYIFRQNRSWQGIQGGTPDPSGYIPVGGNRVNIVNDQAAVSMNGRSAIVRVAQEVWCGPGVRPNISVAFKDTQGRVRDSLAFAQGSYDISYRPDRQRMYLHGSVYQIVFRYTFKSPFHYGLNTVRSSRFVTPWLRCPSNGRCKFDPDYRAP